MKFTKFIPLVCALALTTSGVFAAQTASRNAEYTIEVPTVFDIQESSKVLTPTGTPTIGDDGTSLTNLGGMGVTYTVACNQPGKLFYVHGQTGSAGYPAFNDNVNSMVIVFSMDDVTSAAVTSAISADSAENNPKCFAVAFNRGAHGTTSGADLGDPTLDGSKLTYTVPSTGGTWSIPYTIGTEAVANTFSTKDPAGTYKAKITITDASSL